MNTRVRQPPRTTIAVLSIAVLLGCGAHKPPGPPFSTYALPTHDKALVYVYRPPTESFGYARNYFLRMNGVRVTDLVHGGYSLYEMPPGRLKMVSDLVDSWKIHIVDAASIVVPIIAPVNEIAEATRPGAATLELDVEAGQRYFVKFHPDTGAVHFTPHLYVVSQAVAEGEIKECNQVTDKQSGFW